MSEPRAEATGSYAQLSINTYFVGYCLIRSLPLAVLTRFVATFIFNYTRLNLEVIENLLALILMKYHYSTRLAFRR